MTELIVPPTHREAHTAGMRHHLATGEGPILRKRLELAAVRRSGEEFPVELTVVPFTAVGQSYFLGALRDITELKLLEEERQQTNQLLQRTVSELDARQKALDEHAIVSVTDLQGTILYANGKFNEISGYSNAELLGQNHRLLKSGMHDAAFYEDLWSTISEGSTWQGEIANRRKDGSVYWVTSTIVPILDSQGLPLQYIAIRTDITEQKRSAIRLAQARSRELAVGHQIQQTLLLGQIPKQVSGVSISAYNEASAGIDGDFYEFIPQDDRSFNIIIGDVMGKGIPAALIGAGVKQEMHKVIAARSLTGGLADYGFEPAAVVNDLHHRTFPSLSKLDSFVTMAALRFDPTERRVTYVDAGHTKTILAGRAGTRMLAGENMPLGVLAEESYVQHHVDWRPGDLLLMYSDGLTEARGIGGELFGEERLTRIVEQLRLEKVPAAIVAQAVRKQVRDFRGEQTPSDDSTCIAVHFDHADAGTSPPTQVELHWELAELAALRAEIVQLARNARLADEEADALVLAVSETATNIIRHVPQPPFDAVIHCRATCMARGLDVSFHYLGQPFAPPDGDPDFSGASEGGFGLYIVRNSVDEVSYDTLGFGVQRIQLSKHRRRDGEAARETP